MLKLDKNKLLILKLNILGVVNLHITKCEACKLLMVAVKSLGTMVGLGKVCGLFDSGLPGDLMQAKMLPNGEKRRENQPSPVKFWMTGG